MPTARRCHTTSWASIISHEHRPMSDARHGIMINPDSRFMLAHPAHFIALGFGTGLAPVAPGTVGTLLAYPLFYLLAPQMGAPALFGLILLFFALGIWACGRTGRAMGI